MKPVDIFLARLPISPLTIKCDVNIFMCFIDATDFLLFKMNASEKVMIEDATF